MIIGIVLALVLIFVVYKFVNYPATATPPIPSGAASSANGYNLSATNLALYNALPTGGDARQDFLTSVGVLNTLNSSTTGAPTATSQSNVFSQLGTDISSLWKAI